MRQPDDSLRLCIVGPGRAGLALALAAGDRGHTIVGIVGRDEAHVRSRLDAAQDALDTPRLDTPLLGIGQALPDTDLVVVAVRDDDIITVAGRLSQTIGDPSLVVHLSGLTSVSALDACADAGHEIGSFHPLQTLPTPQIGALRLPGASAAVTGNEDVTEFLERFARSIEMVPFVLPDANKAIYHAGAAAAANFPLAALAMAADLFTAAGVPLEIAKPLVAAIVQNAFELGPRAALTGPVVRGDVATVALQLDSVETHAPEWVTGFAAMVMELAKITGRVPEFDAMMQNREQRR